MSHRGQIPPGGKRPLVSIVVPVFNGERYLAHALNSILAQTYTNWEILVVDNNSTDRSVEVAKRLSHVQILSEPQRGAGAARNRGIQFSKGEILAFLDHDDILTPDKIETQVKALEEDPELDYTTAYQQVFLESGMERPKWVPPELLSGQMHNAHPMTLVARRRAFEVAGLFDPRYFVSEDMEWLARAKDRGLKSRVIERVLLYRRIHDANITHQIEASQERVLTALRESIARKKQSAK